MKTFTFYISNPIMLLNPCLYAQNKMLQVDRMVNEAENFAKGRQGNEGCHRHKESC